MRKTSGMTFFSFRDSLILIPPKYLAEDNRTLPHDFFEAKVKGELEWNRGLRRYYPRLPQTPHTQPHNPTTILEYLHRAATRAAVSN